MPSAAGYHCAKNAGTRLYRSKQSLRYGGTNITALLALLISGIIQAMWILLSALNVCIRILFQDCCPPFL